MKLGILGRIAGSWVVFYWDSEYHALFTGGT